MSNNYLKARDLQLQLPVDQVHAMHTLCDAVLYLHTTASCLSGRVGRPPLRRWPP